MKPDLWMPVYIGDYLRDTTHLTAEQSGVYLHLLFHGWLNDGKLPLSADALAQIGRVSPAKWKKISRPILAFLRKGDGYYYQKRQMAELIRAGETHAKFVERAAKGGAANREAWRKRKAMLEAMLQDSSKDSLEIAPSQPQSPSPLITSKESAEHNGARQLLDGLGVELVHPKKGG